MLTLMLSPVTAVLALNVYNQRRLLGEYFLPVIVGCLVGTLTSVGSVLLLCKLMAVNASMTSALLPKSVTTAIAIAISENLGGIPGVTAAAVVIAGLCAAGETVVTDIHFIERGYENFVGKLRSVGADIVLERDDAEQCVAAAE